MFRKKTEQQNIPESMAPASYAALMRRAMIRSAVFAALAFATVVIATLAWFANNRSTDSTGMQMQIEASPDLIIGKEVSELTSFLSLADRTSVTFDDAASIMRPATHDDTQYTANVLNTNKTGLKYNDNPTEVSFSTGVAKGSTALTFADVPTFGGALGEARYYVDYTVYIASAGKEMQAKSLTAQLDFNGDEPDPIEDHYEAASVDFYLDGAYKGTLNLAGRDTDVLDLMGDSTDDNSSVTIPFHKADANNYLTVMMRFYFDGALEKDPGQAYVYSDNLSPDELSLKVSFEATALTPAA